MLASQRHSRTLGCVASFALFVLAYRHLFEHLHDDWDLALLPEGAIWSRYISQPRLSLVDLLLLSGRDWVDLLFCGRSADQSDPGHSSLPGRSANYGSRPAAIANVIDRREERASSFQQPVDPDLPNHSNANCAIILASLRLASPPAEGDRIPDSELNERIDRELNGSEYSWRNPHHLVSSEKNWLQGFVAWIAKSLSKVSRAINRVVAAITKWWQSLFPHPEGSTQLSNTASAPIWITQLLLYAIVCGLIIAAALIALRILARSKKKKPVPISSAMPVTPNLESETTVADELPEDQWLLLARRKQEDGEPRLALRALFLAVLSLLGAQRLIVVRQSKSNSDYETELRRRRSAELTELFRGNRRLFERCWYGDYPVTDAEIEQSTNFYQRLKHACLAEK
jgi:hypothetical protein